MNIKIRFNNKHKEAADPRYVWRVVIDEVEHLATEVEINVPSKGTKDVVNGEDKWHISCVCNKIIWDEGKVKLENV